MRHGEAGTDRFGIVVRKHYSRQEAIMSVFEKEFPPVREWSGRLPENAVLLDVRSMVEFSSAHIKDAIPLPSDCLAREIRSIVVDPAAPIVVYSQDGARSEAACRELIRIGYLNVVNGGAMQQLASRLGRPMASLDLSAISSLCNAGNMANHE